MNQEQIENIFREMAGEHTMVMHQSAHPHFFRGEADEFLQGFRSKVHFPAVILETCTQDFSPTSLKSLHEQTTIAYMVVETFRRDDWQDISEAIFDAEQIAKDFLARLANKYNLRISSAHAEPIYNTPLKYAGYRMEVTVSNMFDTCRNTNFPS